MKRKTAILLAAILLLSCFTVGAVKINSMKVETISFEDFSDGMNAVFCEYNYGSHEVETQENYEEQNRTYRVVVKSDYKLPALDSVAVVEGYNGLHVYQFDNAESADSAIEYYSKLKVVEYAEEDKYVDFIDDVQVNENTKNVFACGEVAENPTKTQADACGFTALKEYINDNNITYTGEIVVAIIDSGIDSDHEFLAGRVVESTENFIGGTDAEDDKGHGTHIAGIIVDNTPSNVKVKAYKVLNSIGMGTELQCANGIYAAVEDGVDVINLSLAISGNSETIYDAVKAAYDEDITVVASAGNDSRELNDEFICSPASFDECITVMNGYDDYSKLFSTSNYGAPCDIVAPGVKVYSSYLNNRYSTMSGTSMAAPFVSAAASYILLSGKATEPDDVKQIIKDNSIVFNCNRDVGCLWAEKITRDITTVPAVTFSTESGNCLRSFKLELSSELENAEIYYRTSKMSAGTFLKYNNPIDISDVTPITVEVFSGCKGYKTSDIQSESYTFNISGTDLYWDSDENGVVTKYTGTDTNIVVPSVIKGVVTTGIKGNVFASVNPESIVFPKTVTNIFDGAFENMTSLTSVTANGVKNVGNFAFYNCTGLVSLSFGNLQTVGQYAFCGCTSLSDFLFDSVLSIGTSAFERTNLSYVTLNKCKSIADSAFLSCDALVSVGSTSVETIGDYAFNRCSQLSEVAFKSLESVGDHSFYYCTNLRSLPFNKLKHIGAYAFSGTGVTDFVLNNCIDIGLNAFEDCKNLTLVSSESVTSVSDNAFKNCKKLTGVYFPALTEMGSDAFYNCTALKSFSASNVTSIGGNAFYKCKLLEDAVFPKTTSVGDYAFYYCSSLKNVDFSSVETIGNSSFYYCSLPNVYMPELKVIPSSAFSKVLCKGEMYFPAVETVEKGAFSYVSSAKIIFDNLKSFSLNQTEFGIQNIVLIPSTCNLVADSGNGFVKVYGSSSIESFINENGMSFYALSPENSIYGDLSSDYLINNVLCFDVLGFNRSYQWYGSEDEFADDENDVVLIDENSKNLNTTNYNYSYYYCKCTSTDADGTALTFCSAVAKIHPSATWVITEKPTCYSYGKSMLQCNECGKAIAYEQVEMTNHVYNDFYTVTKEPKCSSAGSKDIRCSVCNSIKPGASVEIPALGHDYGEYTVTTEPTCVKSGRKTRYCSRCTYADVSTIPATGIHTPSETWVTVTEPTCTKDGYEIKKCVECGIELERNLLPALGHDMPDGWTVSYEPTCTEDGTKIKTCSRCKFYYVTETTEALGHEYSENPEVVKPSTCSTHGFMAIKCIRCDSYYEDTVVELPLDENNHSFEIDYYLEEHPHYIHEVCSECSFERLNTEKTKQNSDCVYCKYTFEHSNGAGVITSYNLSSMLNEETVPLEIDGVSVKKIGDGAYANTYVSDVIIEDGIEEIGENAFDNCKMLSCVTVPSSVTTIGEGAFSNTEIRCYKNSAAYEYAIENGLEYEIIKDIRNTDKSNFFNDNDSVLFVTPAAKGNLDEMITVCDGFSVKAVPSYKYGEKEAFGTGSQINIYMDNARINHYTVVVMGDVNGDGVCDVLDASITERVVNGFETVPDECVRLAMNNGNDTDPDVNSYSFVVNTVLSGDVELRNQHDTELLIALKPYFDALEKTNGEQCKSSVIQTVGCTVLKAPDFSIIQKKDFELKIKRYLGVEGVVSGVDGFYTALENGCFDDIKAVNITENEDGGHYVAIEFSDVDSSYGCSVDSFYDTVINNERVNTMIKNGAKKNNPNSRSVSANECVIYADIGADGLIHTIMLECEYLVNADFEVSSLQQSNVEFKLTQSVDYEVSYY